MTIPGLPRHGLLACRWGGPISVPFVTRASLLKVVKNRLRWLDHLMTKTFVFQVSISATTSCASRRRQEKFIGEVSPRLKQIWSYTSCDIHAKIACDQRAILNRCFTIR